METEAPRLLAALDDQGLLLQHDRVLPSATAVIAGEPIAGSWWAHPMANPIYDALNELDGGGHLLRCKLVAGKVTLVARRLWPALLAAVTERGSWQLEGVGAPALELLEAVDGAADPVLLDGTNRGDGRRLGERLLVHSTDVHLPTGRHTKALEPWRSVMERTGIERLLSAAAGRAALETVVDGWGAGRPLLPWARR
jgi:hypothetical protein